MTVEEWRARTAKAPKRSKYGNRKVEIDGITFDSAKEGRRYSQLRIREKAGEIMGLKLQPVYPLIVQGVKVCDYVGDFEYEEARPLSHPDDMLRSGRRRGEERPSVAWVLVTEDAKGVRTKDYRIKAKLFSILYGRAILET